MTAVPPRPGGSARWTSNPRQHPGARRAGRRVVVGRRAQGVKLPVYKHLFEINTGFDQIIRA